MYKSFLAALFLLLAPTVAYSQGIYNPGPCISFGSTAGTCAQGNQVVSSITGTSNQVAASGSIGAVTLSLPNTLILPAGTTNRVGLIPSNTGGSYYIGGESSTGGTLLTGSQPYALVIAKYSATLSENKIQFGTNDVVRFTVDEGGILNIASASLVANATATVTFTALGPTGTACVVAEWFQVKNSSGTTRYIPLMSCS